MSANSSDNSSIIQEKIDTHMVGSLTLLMPFLPTILAYIGLICISRKRVDQMASGMTKLEFFLIPLLFLPGVQILTNTAFSILVSGSLIKDFFDMDLTNTDEENSQIEDDRVVSWVARWKTWMNICKAAETIGESAPQFILQFVILLIVAKNPMLTCDYLWSDYKQAAFWSSMLVVITTSYLSLIICGGSYIVESRIIINGVLFTPYMNLKMTIGNTFAMVFTVTPRLLAFALLISSFNSYYAIIPLGIGLLMYMVGVITIYQMFKKELSPTEVKDPFGHRRFFLLFMSITSPVMPCIILNPKWNILTYTSILSASIMIVQLIFLIGIVDWMPDILRSTMIDDTADFRSICLVIILGLILSMSITAIQVALIRRAHLKDFEFQVILGETKAIEERLKSEEPIRCPGIFSFACSAQQEGVVEVMLKHGKGKIDFNDWEDLEDKTGYYWACYFENENIKRMIEENAEELGIDLKLRKNKSPHNGTDNHDRFPDLNGELIPLEVLNEDHEVQTNPCEDQEEEHELNELLPNAPEAEVINVSNNPCPVQGTILSETQNGMVACLKSWIIRMMAMHAATNHLMLTYEGNQEHKASYSSASSPDHLLLDLSALEDIDSSSPSLLLPWHIFIFIYSGHTIRYFNLESPTKNQRN